MMRAGRTHWTTSSTTSEHNMKLYIISLAAGLFVGIIYAVMQVRSPAPPAIALIGLLGMLAGDQALDRRDDLFADQHAEQTYQGNRRRRRGTHLHDRVDDADEQAGGQEIGR